MARLHALCSLPRTNPGNRLQYVRCNGPYTLYMKATGGVKLPYGNIPRLLLAYITPEAVRTQSCVLVLEDSLSAFMRKLGIYRQRLARSADDSARLRTSTSLGEQPSPARRVLRCGPPGYTPGPLRLRQHLGPKPVLKSLWKPTGRASGAFGRGRGCPPSTQSLASQFPAVCSRTALDGLLITAPSRVVT